MRSTPEGPEWGVDRLECMGREWVPAAFALLGARRREFAGQQAAGRVVWDDDAGQLLELRRLRRLRRSPLVQGTDF